MFRTGARPFAFLVLLTWCHAAGSPAAQNAARLPVGDAGISGRVIDRENKAPLEGVIVKLWIPPSTETVLLTQTARDGRYSFDAISPGDYRVTVLHERYASQSVGGPQSAGSSPVPLRLARGERVRGIDFALGRGASFRGRVLDFRGSPIAGALVTAFVVGSLRDGDGFVFPGMIRSDSRGEYLIPGLPEGNYRVSAVCRVDMTGPPQGPTYHPGTARLEDASIVHARAGEAVNGIDIGCPPSDLLRLSGHVLATLGDAPIAVYLLANNSSIQTITLDKEGAFSLLLRSGRYVLCASARDGDFVEAAFLAIDLDSDMTNLTLALTPAATVSGRLVTADGSPRPNALFQVAAVLADRGKEIDPVRRDRVDVSAEGTFEIRGLFGERLLQVIGVPDGWQVQRILRGKEAVGSLSLGSGDTIADIVVVFGRQ